MKVRFQEKKPLTGIAQLIAAAFILALAAAACGPSQSQPGIAGQPPERRPGAPILDPNGQPSLVPITHAPGLAGGDQASSEPPGFPDAVGPRPTRAEPPQRAGMDLCANSRAPGTPNPPAGIVCAKCTEGKFIHPDAGRKKFNIVIFADTSPSLESTRSQIVEGLTSFVAALPPSTDYRIGVFPSHSDEGLAGRKSSGLGGQLWAGGPGGARVLRSAAYRDRKDPMLSLSKDLASRLVRMPIDPATDAGEAGLLSLNLALTKYWASNSGKDSGIFEPGIPTAVIFFSDENDICAVDYYPGSGSPSIHPEAPSAMNTEHWSATDPTPVEHKAHDLYCNPDYPSPHAKPEVAPASVLAKLRERLPGTPLLLSAIVYHKRGQGVPLPPAANANDPKLTMSLKYWHEKDFGWGYIDIVEAAGGMLVDMNATEYSTGLQPVAEASGGLLSAKTPHKLLEGTGVDSSTLCLTVNGQQVPQIPLGASAPTGLSYTYNPATRNVDVIGVGPANTTSGDMEVHVMYCEPPGMDSVLTQDKYLPSDEPATRAAHYPAIAQLLGQRQGCAGVAGRLPRLAQ